MQQARFATQQPIPRCRAATLVSDARAAPCTDLHSNAQLVLRVMLLMCMLPESAAGLCACPASSCMLVQQPSCWLAACDPSLPLLLVPAAPPHRPLPCCRLPCLALGCEGIAAINTIRSVMGINLDTLRPEPCVEGYSTPGGYSYRAVKPIALEKVMSISRLLQQRGFREQGTSLSGIGGVETGGDAAEFILLGCDTVQVCTGVMVHGYPMVRHLCGGLQAFMAKHGFSSITDFQGAALPYFTTHGDLVVRQKAALAERKAARIGLDNDTAWTGDGFVAEAESMVSNRG
eukprot:GHRQ01019896.1.p1 GENE.GHRQ01019896.1~~GHRQ01019896.1.p1  ORF type:complete len:289 (+),score=87.39 GHRQ01019896.1:498-1364(+)